MKGLDPCSCASAVQNQDFIWIYTKSGRGLCSYDPEGKDALLALEADDAKLGLAMKKSLASSRFMTPFQARRFFDSEAPGEQYDRRVKAIMKMQGYKTKSAMFRKMIYCSVTMSKGLIEISPWIHYSLQAWKGPKDAKTVNVVIAAERPDHMIGAALRLAFGRCR
jgi:hypothetical protein